MKLKMFLLACASLLFSTGCGTRIFTDNFEADVLGNAPLISPAGNPPDDSLNIQGPSGSIIVIASAPHGSKAVKIDRTSQLPQVILGCVTGGGPHTSGDYTVFYKAYSVNINAEPVLTSSVRSSDGQRAFELKLTGGGYQLSSGAGTETLPGGYSANVVHSIFASLDMDASTFRVSINGTTVASGKPFLDSGFDDLHLLRFEYPAPLLEALPGTYVVDDIVIRKK